MDLGMSHIFFFVNNYLLVYHFTAQTVAGSKHEKQSAKIESKLSHKKTNSNETTISNTNTLCW